MFSRVLWGIFLFTSLVFSLELHLHSGWNLLALDSNVTLNSFKNSVGVENLLVIQSEDKVYKKSYVDANKSFLNDFESFSDTQGAWVKVAKNAVFDYKPKQFVGSPKLELKEGWNLIKPTTSMDLQKILEQLGSDNVEVILGEDGAYKKSYVDNNRSYLNDFKGFDPHKGYWVKVKSSSSVKFTTKPTLKALSFNGEVLVQNVDNYRVELWANNYPANEISNDYIAVDASIEGDKLTTVFKVNSTYPADTVFLLKVFDSSGNLLAHSKSVTIKNELISFENIAIDNSNNGSSGNNSSVDESLKFRGIQLYALNMPISKYKLNAITDSDLNRLSNLDKLKIANKLLASLYYGMPYKRLQSLLDNGNFIATLKQEMQGHSSNFTQVQNSIMDESLYKDDCYCNMKALAMLYHLKMGKEFIDRWAAYVLNQTILFSPAYELSTVSRQNICNVNAELVNGFSDHYTMEYITLMHTMSENNWRRFRSPEDNGREMLEIYNMDFNDTKVPIAAKALQNWHLEGSSNTLIVGPNRNSEPLNLFGTTIYNGVDFYSGLVKNSKFKQTVVKRLVNIYFPYYTKSQKADVAESILSSNPMTFEDLLLQIVFSKEYLYNSQKYMSAEERFLSLAKKMDMNGEGYYYFVYIRKDLEKMHQASMHYKLGRTDTIPSDTYSTTIYKNFIRSYMLDPVRGEGQWGWNPKVVIEDGFGKEPKDNLSEYIDYIFKNMLNRKPLDREKELLTRIIGENTSDRLNITNIIFAYIVKLNEFYRFDSIKG